ncbi:Alpha/Beta hydrolase protein [Colletotrichum godetiae]|uniref:Carboxylic ester hydrolase n=1 Tax=Colletotrichum godetiae TaxID=1209918 RepID=A0AAJ0EXA0_9PEZI|nr:Alpha/Beta hydrolase protein [Colletotrichum godetiae]KAK1675025.1 Alpha/Beta hydrolase protein [Colletotrichum godetiae]
MNSLLTGAVTLACTSLVSASRIQTGNDSTSLPIVDLDYELHQALNFDTSSQAYNFSNIRYGAPPIGDLRFAAPVPPTTDRSVVQKGEEARICPQALPDWTPGLLEQAYQYVLGPNISLSGGQLLDSRASEDCLFLDVVVPKKIFDATKSNETATKAPVLVWIYGGGYDTGSKAGLNSGSPAGLLRQGNHDFVYVALNYRLGAFGFLSGPEFTTQGGVTNAGLLDQRLALEWIQQNIHLFGGDAARVTLAGESAGGGSLVYQTTAFGGSQGSVPFQQIIPQSPAILPSPPAQSQNNIFAEFLSRLNVSTLAEAMQLPSSAVIAANYDQVFAGRLGSFTFSPVVDGAFVPAEPAMLISEGKFDTKVNVMAGSNTNDGLFFGSFNIIDDAGYREWMSSILLGASADSIDYMATDLYPPILNGSYGYTDHISRTALTMQDLLFRCNGLALARALNGTTHQYEFGVFPAMHAEDVAYTFSDDGAGMSSPETAIALQRYMASFALSGNPHGHGVMEFPMYERDENVLLMNATGQYVSHYDSLTTDRCIGRDRVIASLAV